MSNTADDLLSFKEFDTYARNDGGRAEININSPKKSPNFQYDDDHHLNNLVQDMSTSVQILGAQDSAGGQISQHANQNDGSEEEQQQQQETSNHSFFTIEYYQQFFNVDTTIVIERILSSMVPRRAPSTYLKQNIGRNPDLYGPVWIVITLIFSIAISGNIASYMQHANSKFHWRYNFHLVSIAATTIILYVCLIPAGLWAAFKWFVRPADPDLDTEGPYTPSLLTLICVYGYSMVIYIPVSILWVIQISFLQWILVISATFLSGSALVLVLTPALRVSRGSLMFAVGIIIAHFLLATGFMLYFFHTPDNSDPITIETAKQQPVIREIVDDILTTTLAAVVDNAIKT